MLIKYVVTTIGEYENAQLGSIYWRYNRDTNGDSPSKALTSLVLNLYEVFKLKHPECPQCSEYEGRNYCGHCGRSLNDLRSIDAFQEWLCDLTSQTSDYLNEDLRMDWDPCEFTYPEEGAKILNVVGFEKVAVAILESSPITFVQENGILWAQVSGEPTLEHPSSEG